MRFDLAGESGELPAAVATSLAVVINELLQNVVDHAYSPPRPLEVARVLVELDNDGQRLLVRVSDDGVGLPDGFDTDGTGSLGLSIVRTLVASELHGHITFSPGSGPADRPGTVVELVTTLFREHDDEPMTGPVPIVS
jgi:two-component sensor histidine kinase